MDLDEEQRLITGLLWLFLLQLGFVAVSLEPGVSISIRYLDFDNLPDTNFSCIGRVVGGYYADTATACQMFHVCTLGQNNETMDIRFLCLNGTVFEQSTRVCERIDEVDCEKSEQYYHLNNELYGGMDPLIIRSESEAESPTTPSTTTTTSGTVSSTTTNPYYGTIKQTTTRQKISSFTSDSPADIRFDPKVINLQLNSDPSLGANIKPISYQQQSYNDDKSHHTIVTTHSYKSDIPKTIYDNFKNQNLKPTDINYEFEYQDQEQFNPPSRKNYRVSNVPNYSPSASELDDYIDDAYKGSTYRTIYHTPSSKSLHQDDSSTYKTPITFTPSSNPQSQYSFERTEVPIKQQVSASPSIFSSLSSPAPFTHSHHLEAKRNTDHHKIKKSFSLSISDQNGKELIKVNNTPISDIFPESYLDYKDDDVTLIPIFQDVPRLKKRRQKRNSEKKNVFKADPEAADVLRFLINWYTNYEKTTKISIPLTSEAITEINDELAAAKEKNENNLYDTDDKEEEKNDISDLKKRENEYFDDYYYEIDDEENDNKNSSNITVSLKELDSESDFFDINVTETSKNETDTVSAIDNLKESTKNYTDYLEEYIDDNYEPLTYNNSGYTSKTTEKANEIPEDLMTTLSSLLYDYVDDNYESSIYKNTSENAKNISLETSLDSQFTISTTTEHEEIPTTDATFLTIEETTQYFSPGNDITQTTSRVFNKEASFHNSSNTDTEVYAPKKVENDNQEIEYTTILPKTIITTSESTTENLFETTIFNYASQLPIEQTSILTDSSSTTLSTAYKSDKTEVPIISTTYIPETSEPISEAIYTTESTLTSTEIPTAKENLQEIIKDIEGETKSVATTIVMTGHPPSSTSTLETIVTEIAETTTETLFSTNEPEITTADLSTSITTPNLIKTTSRLNLFRGRQNYFSRRPTTSSKRGSSHRFNLPQRRYDRRKDKPSVVAEEKTKNYSVNDVNIGKFNTRSKNNNTVFTKASNSSIVTENPIKENEKHFATLQKTSEETITDASLSKSANPTLAKETKDFLATTPISKHIRVKFRKEKVNKKYMFTCFDKKINKFYSDPRDCRLFHYCSQGYTSNQLVDMKFVCDLGTYFDDIKLICTKEKPARCL